MADRSVLPVGIVGGGPVGLVAALGLVRYGIPVVVFEEDGDFSRDTKAGTTLSRTLEVLHRYGAVDEVLRHSVRVDEIGDVERATGTVRPGVRMGELVDDTRYPFVVNIPQQDLEPALARVLEEQAPGTLQLGHRVSDFTDTGDGVELTIESPSGTTTRRVRYLLGCDGGRSAVRKQLGVEVDGKTLEERYMLVDLDVDLDVANPRDYPQLAYFSDPDEWMILVRLPHCWRFVFPLAAGKPVPDTAELRDKAVRFIGEVDQLRVLGSNVYAVHHRVAARWRQGRVFLLGDAAHLITPMWALGLNTGVLDASNLPWRLAWVLRGWADESLLDGYESEQAPVAVEGSGRMAEAAYAYLRHRGGADGASGAPGGSGAWGNAMTRGLLGVRLAVDAGSDWSMTKSGDRPQPILPGDRLPDLPLFADTGRVYLHDLVADHFVALYFCDVRRGPRIPAEASPGLRHLGVSRWDAPFGTKLRERALFDPAERVRRRLGVPDNTLVLARPDGHVAAVRPFDPRSSEPIAETLYAQITGRSSTAAKDE